MFQETILEGKKRGSGPVTSVYITGTDLCLFYSMFLELQNMSTWHASTASTFKLQSSIRVLSSHSTKDLHIILKEKKTPRNKTPTGDAKLFDETNFVLVILPQNLLKATIDERTNRDHYKTTKPLATAFTSLFVHCVSHSLPSKKKQTVCIRNRATCYRNYIEEHTTLFKTFYTEEYYILQCLQLQDKHIEKA